MKALNLTFAAVLAACLTGCSSDPSASDFERFAREYGENVLTGAKASEEGYPRNLVAKLEKFDLRKTDSVVSPFVGTAVYRVNISGTVFRSTAIKGYEAPCEYDNRLTVNWAHRDGEWKPQDANIECLAINIKGVDDMTAYNALRNELLPKPILVEDIQQIADGELWSISARSMWDLAKFKKDYRIKD